MQACALRWAPVCLLLAVGALSSAWCLRGGFYWDDRVVVLGHPAVLQLERAPMLFVPGYWHRAHPDLPSPYRPIRETAFAAMAKIGHGGPLPYHALSLALHLANILLVYALACRLMRARGAALLAGVLFAAHPVHVEAVYWAKNVGELLALCFALISLLTFERAARSERTWKCVGWLPLSLAAYALGLLSKESAAALPLILVAAAFLLTSGAGRKRALLLTIPFWAVSAVYGLLQWQVLSMGGRTFLAAKGVPAAARITLVAKTVLAYLGMMIFPVRVNPWRELRFPATNITWFAAFWGAALLIGLAVFFARRSRVMGFAWMWACLALAPAANVAVNAKRPIAEQRLYMPSVGICLWLAAVIWAGTRKTRAEGRGETRTLPRVILASAIACVLTATSMAASVPWSSRLALWRYVVRLRPRSAQAHNNLAIVYELAGTEPLVVCQYLRVARLDARHVEARYNLGTFYLRKGLLNRAERELRAALAIEPTHARALNNLGRLWERRGRPEDALAAYESAIRVKPSYAAAHYNAGTVYEQAGRLQDAERAYARAVGLNPKHAQAHTNLGNLLLGRRDAAGATAAYAKALRADPRCWQAHAGMAAACARTGRLDQAAASYQAALRLAPKGSGAATRLRLDLARVLLGAGRVDEAGRVLAAVLKADPANDGARRLLERISRNRDREATPIPR